MKLNGITLIKLAVGGLLVYFILEQVNIDQLIVIIQSADRASLFIAFFCWLGLSFLGAFRWALLAKAAKVPVNFLRSLQLLFIGFFFNNFMFGSTGGDVMRAYLVTQNLTENRWRAAISVIVDRVIGLFALLSIAFVVLIAFSLFDEEAFSQIPGIASVRKFLLISILAFVVLVCAYLSSRVRKALKLEVLVSKMPGQKTIPKIHDAISLYRNQLSSVLGAFLVSIPLQFLGIACFFFIAEAVGSSLSFRDQAIIFPLVQTASAVPIAPAGWGVGEQLYGWFFQRFGDSLAIGVAASIVFRILSQICFGVIGGIIWMLSSDRQAKK